MKSGIREISVWELKRKLARRERLQLIDVRSADEYQLCSLKNALHIPLEKLPTTHHQITRDHPVIIYCHFGIRSVVAADYLTVHHGFDNLWNLEGGIHAWAQEIDHSMLCY